MPLEESDPSSLTTAENSVSLIDESVQHSTSSFTNVSGPHSQQQIASTIYQFATHQRMNHQAIDSTGVLKRLAIPRTVSMPATELLAGLIKFSEPVEITLEDCSGIKSKLEVLKLIAAHYPRLITLKLCRCGTLLTTCFEQISFLSPRAMNQLASGLDLSHLRILTLHDLPAATSPHASLLLERLADRLSTHLLQLDLSNADFSCFASFGWLSRLRHLRVLILVNCKLPSDRSPLIFAICELVDLIRLDLADLSLVRPILDLHSHFRAILLIDLANATS